MPHLTIIQLYCDSQFYWLRIYNYMYLPATGICNQCLSPVMLWLNTAHGDVYSIQHYVIKFVSDLLQVAGFLQVLRFLPLTKQTDHHDITENTWNIVGSGIKHYNPKSLILCKTIIIQGTCINSRAHIENYQYLGLYPVYTTVQLASLYLPEIFWTMELN